MVTEGMILSQSLACDKLEDIARALKQGDGEEERRH